MEVQLPTTPNFIPNRETKYFLKLVMTHRCEHRTRTKKDEDTNKTKKKQSSLMIIMYVTVNKDL